MLYHREISWSEDFDTQINNILDNYTNIYFSRHLRGRNDRKHNINPYKLNRIITVIKYKHSKAFECEVVDNKIVKFVIRVNYDYKRDISIVFGVREHYLKIATVWLNKRQDKHITLDKNKYNVI